jgi:hypothetical protein
LSPGNNQWNVSKLYTGTQEWRCAIDNVVGRFMLERKDGVVTRRQHAHKPQTRRKFGVDELGFETAFTCAGSDLPDWAVLIGR